MPNFIILLPPAEGKQPGGNPFAPDMFDYRTSNTFNYFNELNPQRRKLINALQEVIRSGEADLEAIFGVKGDSLEQAIEANLSVYDAPLMSALDRYSPGVMYKSMDFGGLPTGAQRRLLENGIIFSGMFGLLRPDDLIPDYKLKMDAVLPGIGKVGSYWRPLISPVLNRRVENRFVWNLLPGVHRDSWDDEHTYERSVSVRFVIEQDGERKAVTHGVKPLRGQLVNFIVRETVDSLEPLLEWRHPAGYVYDPDVTEDATEQRESTITFVKKG
ncbi:MAG: YaaA family protein [Rhodothermales bacterium]